MEWAEAISKAIKYIEEHITEDITMYDVAGYVNVSPFYFHKGFSILCGYSIAEYIRNRRMALAGEELIGGDITVTELAMKYGYDSPDSFTKAFSRFHGNTPLTVRKDKTMLKAFSPLKITISLKGGCIMDYRIVKKESFIVMGAMKKFTYENAQADIPAFWQEHYKKGNGKYVCGMYGICFDGEMKDSDFDYMIADVYNPCVDIPEGFVTRTVPAFTWAVFPIKGSMPDALQDVNKKIFSEWLPALVDYEIAAGYSVEMYDDPAKFPKGTLDENYYSEIWVPVKKK